MSTKRLQSTALIVLGAIVLIFAVYSIENQLAARQVPAPTAPPTSLPAAATEIRETSPQRLSLIAQLTRQYLRGTPAPSGEALASLNDLSDGVYVALRSRGIEVASAWTESGTTGEQIAKGIELAIDDLNSTDLTEINAVEICISYNTREIPSTDLPANLERGILGFSISYNGEDIVYSPTEMIAKNLSFDSAVERMTASFDVSEEELLAEGIFQVFDCEQMLVSVDSDQAAIPLFRGNQIVPIKDVTLENTFEFADLASDWLVRQVQDDGRMVYQNFPSRGEEAANNNMIRQWMATVALDRIAAINDNDATLVELTRKNILYNLENFYVEENGLGLIDYAGEVKLGAIALAALALHEHPDATEFAAQIDALKAATYALWREDGSFETFYRPESRSGQNQNFYPGETLLFWSVLYAEEQDPELLERFMQSFRYYRDWHRDNINPAFIPWHTQAYYNIWKITGNEELKDFIFEMNDWLLDFQEIGKSPYPDLPGRFYDSDRTQYGPPHASSDGVYLEGLVDTYLLAKETTDTQRQGNYARAIRYVIRSLMQLQFADEIDMYYVSKTASVLGGVRTTQYDNSIRVDNVQHGLMGVLKILSIPEAQDIFEQ